MPRQQPLPRQPSFSRPFPTLSLFAVYRAAPFPTSSDDGRRDSDAQLEASKVLYLWSNEPGVTDERKARLMGTVLGMADFAKMLTRDGAPSVRAVHSQRQRMVWLEAEPGYFVHATIALPRSPRHARGVSTATTSSGDTTEARPWLDDASLLAAMSSAYHDYRLLHGSLAGKVEHDGRDSLVEQLAPYWTAWTSKWSVEGGDPRAFEQVLHGVKRSPLSTVVSDSQLAPLLAQFAASNSFVLPILLHGTAPISLPALHPSPPGTAPTSTSASPDPSSTRPLRTPPPPFTQPDLLALVRHLERYASRPAPLSLRAPKPSAHPPPAPPASLANADDSKRWSDYYTLGMGSYLSAPSMPGLPSMPGIPSMPAVSMPSMPGMPAMPALSMPSFPSLSSTPPSREDSPSHGWRLRNVSWPIGGGGAQKSKKTGAIKPTVAEVEAAEQQAAALSIDNAASVSESHVASPTLLDAAAQQLEPGEEPPTPSQPVTPAVELEPDFDQAALAEAIATQSDAPLTISSTLDVNETRSIQSPDADEKAATRTDETAEDDDQVSQNDDVPLVMHCGDGTTRDTKVEVRKFERGQLTLALATLPLSDNDTIQWLTSRARRLLEAAETLLELIQAPPAPYAHRHLLQTGSLFTSHHWPAEQHWSGKTNSEDTEIAAALFDCSRGSQSDPPIFETFFRLSSSQWVIARRAEDLTSLSGAPTLTDVYVVLPAKVGKEGSLVDAAEELRKLERAYPRGLVA